MQEGELQAAAQAARLLRELQAAGSPLGLAPACDQPRPFEHAEVFGDGRHAHLEWLGELGDRALA